MKKFVVNVSIEGVLVQTWLAKTTTGWTITESLLLAKEFDTPADALKALGEWQDLTQSWVLGFQVIFKGLCRP